MALQRKIAEGITKMKIATSTNEDGILTTTETWTGPHGELLIKQNSVINSAKSTALTPTDAGEGQLTITFESLITYEADPEDIIERFWQELRLPVASAPAFAALTADQKRLIRIAAEGDEDEATLPIDAGELGAKLYDLLAGGTPEYAIGVPVIRRTRTRRTNPGTGGAWFRQNPPALMVEGYEYMKTTDEVRKERLTYTQTEEWTGAEVWDPVLYPV